jgi:hypothetical protein
MNLNLVAFARMITIPAYVVVAYAVTSVALCAAVGVRLYRRWQLHKALKGAQAVAQELVNVVEHFEKTFLNQNPSLEENVELLLSSSPIKSSNVSSIVVTSELVILQQQLENLRSRVEQSKNEIIEVQKIDPILEATLKYAVENLTKRIDTLEKQSLTKWDVAAVVLQVMAYSVALVGLALTIIKFMHP